MQSWPDTQPAPVNPNPLPPSCDCTIPYTLVSPPRPMDVETTHSIRADTIVAQTVVAPRVTAYKLRLNGNKQSQRFTLSPEGDGSGVILTRNTADPSACTTTSMLFNLPLNVNEPVGITAGWNSDMYLGTAMNPDHIHLTPNGKMTIKALKPDIIFSTEESEWSLEERLTRIESNITRVAKSQVRIIGSVNGDVSQISLSESDIGSFVVNTTQKDVIVTLPQKAQIGSLITLVQAGSGAITLNSVELLAIGTSKTSGVGDVVKLIALPSSQNVGDTKWMMLR
jgi:hypothetical protein